MKKFIWSLLLVILAGSAYYGYQYHWPSQEVVEFNPGQEPVVYLEGRQLDEDALFLLEGDQLLIAVSLVESMTSAHIFWDQPEETLVVTTGDHVYRFQPLRTFYMINGRAVDLEVPMQVVNNHPFVPLSFLESFLNVDWIFRQTDQVLVLDEKRTCRLVAEALTEKAVIREAPHIKASLYTETPFPGDQLLVYETYAHWLKIRTANGLIGFIQKKDVKRYEECRPE
ncbi:MAG: copper amine oxidase N-terminal domain-containing protein [Bacillota bacterium]|nr:copper amine oxidase N-terminal domain-containing protein [Bacillota bacterium]MDW7678205.1 copper amine oxidase N-terminal domain-containing protein [Bacillota bacterium]